MTRRRERLRTWVEAGSVGLVVAGLAVALGGLFLPGTSTPTREQAPPAAVDAQPLVHRESGGQIPRRRHPHPQPGPVPAASPTDPVSGPVVSGPAPSGPTVAIPAIGVRAGIVSEGIDRTPGDVGNLAIPDAARQVGWWDGGPAPGQDGVAVLAGHRVDDWAFWRLPEVQVGDAVRVTEADGHTTDWTVNATQQVGKADLPESIWTTGGPPKLALVTCGGTFDPSTGHYDDNVIVWATPAT